MDTFGMHTVGPSKRPVKGPVKGPAAVRVSASLPRRATTAR